MPSPIDLSAILEVSFDQASIHIRSVVGGMLTQLDEDLGTLINCLNTKPNTDWTKALSQATEIRGRITEELYGCISFLWKSIENDESESITSIEDMPPMVIMLQGLAQSIGKITHNLPGLLVHQVALNNRDNALTIIDRLDAAIEGVQASLDELFPVNFKLIE